MNWNKYYRIKLTDQDVINGRHRKVVGGRWKELGKLQWKFMVDQGLQPGHMLLDVGCGSLRGGLHFIRYLNEGHYCGMDLNRSLIKAGKTEVANSGLLKKRPRLLTEDQFRFDRFNQKFDWALAVSVFTHLPINVIQRCLINIERSLKKRGKFYATFFESGDRFNLDPIPRWNKIVTHFDQDPYHYHVSVFKHMIEGLDLRFTYIGDWGHPRNQKMICFEKRK
ncbi:class I SAM-dependent methyltransferase [Desmospora profundinema]|uniref:Cyclopropane fatty-acyl-phospholipid synthase-like methyltransferase n=1 Tax=Desmospora profundinema TaxID=1571184 RepID=A0ABU1IRN9_9BACL|nr:class I SAM-dependent methyltransferase [Desmospora profundinema]MDR6227462.1 cyclopropane fatty-acyl-phospholipid synthase-like methyltransferase [Desmospora profundinema]